MTVLSQGEVGARRLPLTARFPTGSFLRVAPALALLTVGVLVPVGVFFVYSFWQADLFGLVKVRNLDQYERVASDGFTRSLVARTLLLGGAVASITVVLAYFTAYAISFSVRRGRSLILLAIVISMVASYLVRVFSWKLILARKASSTRRSSSST
jgi:ABC-type spermidine/putrescine transport system permease subunit I